MTADYPETPIYSEKEAPFLDSPLVKTLGAEKANKLLKKYIADLNQKVALLFEYVDKGNTIQIRKIAHQLKGSGKSYGLGFVSDVGMALSSSAKDGDLSALRDLVRELHGYIEKKAEIFE